MVGEGDGNYLLPSLVLDPAPELRIVAEEQFGPALPVIPYDSEAEAVALANGTWSGLCSSVWSGDTEHAMKIAKQLRTGITFFNNRELGHQGMNDFSETHVMSVPSD